VEEESEDEIPVDSIAESRNAKIHDSRSTSDEGLARQYVGELFNRVAEADA